MEECRFSRYVQPFHNLTCSKINRIDKVIGHLPDFGMCIDFSHAQESQSADKNSGEELALRHLQAMCDKVQRIYKPGARVTIASDGLAFNGTYRHAINLDIKGRTLTLQMTDLYGISSEEAWEYSQSLIEMAACEGLSSIEILRLSDIMGLTTLETINRKSFTRTIPSCRRILAMQLCDPDEYIANLLKTDPDAQKTYLGFKKYLELDLRYNLLSFRHHDSPWDFQKELFRESECCSLIVLTVL